MVPWLRYLFAFVVGCQGFTYTPSGIPMPDTHKEWTGRSQLFGSGLTGNRLKSLVGANHIMPGITILACAFAIALSSWPPACG
jgi:hypothetical protein